MDAQRAVDGGADGARYPTVLTVKPSSQEAEGEGRVRDSRKVKN